MPKRDTGSYKKFSYGRVYLTKKILLSDMNNFILLADDTTPSTLFTIRLHPYPPATWLTWYYLVISSSASTPPADR